VLQRIASRREEAGDDPLPELERAAALDPEDAERHLHIAQRAELAGNLVLTEQSLLRAAALNSLYQPRYLLAAYYSRRGNLMEFRRWARAALQPAVGDVSGLLNLCWRIEPDGRLLAEFGRSEKPEIGRQCLATLVSHNLAEAARPLALRTVESPSPEDLPGLLGFCNLTLSLDRKQDGLEVWNRLCRKGLLPYKELETTDQRLLTNSEFTRTPLAAGFDWHFESAAWIRSVVFGTGLRMDLTGSQPDECLIGWEYAPTVPRRRFRLRWMSRAVDPGQADGFSLVPFDLGGQAIKTERLGERRIRFVASGQVIRLAMMYQRPRGSVRLKGAVLVESVSMEAEP
jgi:hypothetical protein